MSQDPFVVSVVAKSGSGKTTLIERLLPALRSHDLKVGVLKHHHHRSSFDTAGKDTFRFADAGADVVVGASPVQVAVFRREDGNTDLDAVIRTHFDGMDLVIVEGYKRGSYPKIEVNRAARATGLLCAPDELLALVSDQNWGLDVPAFGLDDTAELASFLVAAVQSGPT